MLIPQVAAFLALRPSPRHFIQDTRHQERDMPKLTSFPEFDSSHSKSLGDDHRVVVMKGALLSELMQQPRVLTEFPQWAVKTGLQTVMDDVATGKQPVTSLIEAIPPAAKLLQEDAVRLAAKLDLPYRWVVQGLLHGFSAGLVGIATGQEIVLPLPQITATYDPMEKRPPGRKSDPAVIERYTKWYVRCRIGGVKESALAQEYHETYHKAHYHKHTWKEDRETIIDGIKTIDRLLKLTQ